MSEHNENCKVGRISCGEKACDDCQYRIRQETPMSEHILTDEQLYDLRDDIKEGISMIVEKNHYYQLEALANSQPALLAACKFAKAHIKKGSPKKALPVLRAAIKAAPKE